MNDLTRRIVIETAKRNKSWAKKNDWHFAGMVEHAYWDELLGTYGWRIKEKLMGMIRTKCPEYFDEEGFLLSHVPEVYDLELELSEMVVEYLQGRFLDRHPEWELHSDWGDLPRLTVEPQLNLFEVEA